MKKNLVLVAIILFSTLSYAELFLEITKGSEDPFKVAMIPFEGNSRVSKQLNNIMRNDLIRTGEFAVLDEELLLPVKMIEDELVFNDWKLLGMDYLVTGTIVKSNNSLDINYEIYDVHILPGKTRPNIMNTIRPDYKEGVTTPNSTYWAKKK